MDVLAAGGSGAGVCAGTWREGRGGGGAAYGGTVLCGMVLCVNCLLVVGKELCF